MRLVYPQDPWVSEVVAPEACTGHLPVDTREAADLEREFDVHCGDPSALEDYENRRPLDAD